MGFVAVLGVEYFPLFTLNGRFFCIQGIKDAFGHLVSEGLGFLVAVHSEGIQI